MSALSESAPIGLPSHALEAAYDVVVIGSGYGGAVVAARLAQAGVDVAVLERGREWLPGQFPEDAPALARAARFEVGGATLGGDDALFRFLLGPHQGALTGVGLGGTSLINAGVVLRPRAHAFEGGGWPRALLDDERRFEDGYQAAWRMLEPKVMPAPQVQRLQGLAPVHGPLGRAFEPVPLAVALEGGASAGGRALRPCTQCGNCITGCNHHAKGSLWANYLPAAARAGAALVTGVEVERLEPGPRGVRVLLRPVGLGRERFERTPLSVRAKVVVLAAGALGTAEVLLRSKAAGTPLSDRVGHGFTGNGTFIGFSAGVDRELAALAGGGGAVGPTLSGMFDVRGGEVPMLIQDTAVPAALRRAVRLMTASFGARGKRVVGWSVTAGDSSEGRLVLRGGRVAIDWPHAGRARAPAAVDARLDELARLLGGRHVPNPAWARLPTKPVLTTHPLGGAAMAEHAGQGVVDHRHRLFAGASGAAVHPQVYVCDGSVYPKAPGTNPLWTICALAERCADDVLVAHPALTRRPSRAPRLPTTPTPPGLRFTERMAGFFVPGATARVTPDSRPPGAVSLSFLLTVEWPSLQALEADPATEATTFGTLRCDALDPEPLTVAQGRFRLFVDVGAQTEMKHAFTATAADGARYALVGTKFIQDDPGPDLYFDTRTLFLEVRRDGTDALLGTGVVQTGPLDLAQQVQTIHGVGTQGAKDLAARARFLKVFLGRVRRVYGGLVLPLVR